MLFLFLSTPILILTVIPLYNSYLQNICVCTQNQFNAFANRYNDKFKQSPIFPHQGQQGSAWPSCFSFPPEVI